MEKFRPIDPAEINPADFQDTTLYVEPVANSRWAFVAVVRVPRMVVGEGTAAVTILDRAPGLQGDGRAHLPGPFVVAYDAFVRGGESAGLKLPGILEEAALIYGSE